MSSKGDDLARYLRAIMGDERRGFLEVRPLALAGGAAEGREWFGVDAWGLAAAVVHVERLAAAANVYVGVAPRDRREGHALAVPRVWCLWVDVDSDRMVRERLWPFRPSPSIVVRSGSGGAHAYWLLEEPLKGDLAQRANRRLALALAADPKATDCARILRPPGTLNHKHSPATRVEATRMTEVRYSARDVVGALPDTEHYRRVPPRRSLQRSPVSESQLDGLVRTVLTAAQGGRNDALFWALCRGFEHVAAGLVAESTMLDALGQAGREVGLSEGEVGASVGSARRNATRVTGGNRG